MYGSGAVSCSCSLLIRGPILPAVRQKLHLSPCADSQSRLFRCKTMDCVEVCPVDCFYEGENMLVIHPDECIDCGVCEPECPVDAIKPDTEPGLEKWLSLNAEYAKIWPNITVKRAPPPDWKEWEGKPDKLQYFSPKPGPGD